MKTENFIQMFGVETHRIDNCHFFIVVNNEIYLFCDLDRNHTKLESGENHQQCKMCENKFNISTKYVDKNKNSKGKKYIHGISVELPQVKFFVFDEKCSYASKQK